MGYPMPGSRRPRRQRRWWVVILIGGLIGIVALAVSFRNERRNVSAYLEVAKQVADAQDDIALSLQDLFLNLGESQRNDVLDRLARLEDDSVALQNELAAAPVAGPVTEANAFLTVAISAWADAIASLDDAFLLILDEADDRLGQSMLETAFDTLRVGDLAYSQFEASLTELEEGVVTREYPTVRYVAHDRPQLYEAGTVSQRLLALGVLSERHDLAVSGVIEPPPAGEQNGFPVLPWTESVEVQAVVTNSGNEAEFDVPVTLSYKALGGSETTAEERIVAVLDPGAATTVVFSDLDITSGVIYEIEVRVALQGDADGENDVWSMKFVRNTET